MDPIYAPAFQSQLQDLMNVSPDKTTYSRLAALVEAADNKTDPKGLLRIDGALFLVLNLGAMIVIPWQRTHGSDFFAQYRADLEQDVIDVLIEAKAVAAQLQLRELSANLLLSVTGTRRGGQRTRGSNIWGP